MTTDKIEGTADAWENDALGIDQEHTKKVQLDSDKLDAALDLQMISIRLQKSLLKDLKEIAKLNGIGYQPLMKQILKRFVDCEMKKMANEYIIEQRKEIEALEAQLEAEAQEEQDHTKAS